MQKNRSKNLKKVVLTAIRNLTVSQLKQVLDYVMFLETRRQIDPSQAYFWTKKWQTMEKSVYADKKAGRIIGNGTSEGLLKALHQ
ncbi:MAG: hypothetical protein NC930_07630 [Candidatus Omnitrophica bacterium]|nr:hypothetical protein [Candidatus Omnitrophota bacterium]